MKSSFLTIILFCSSFSIFPQERQNIQNNYLTETSKTQSNNKEEFLSGIPNADWVNIYFSAINKRTDKAGIKSLRKTILAKDDIEVRGWMGFSFGVLEGFVLRRIKNIWSAVYLDTSYFSKKSVYSTIKIDEPKSGWNKLWARLLNAEILTMPDAQSINCNAQTTDGTSYVFEIKKGESYRIYRYENPDAHFPNKCKEADQVLEINKMIVQEFGIK